jgi:hypothetical protein
LEWKFHGANRDKELFIIKTFWSFHCSEFGENGDHDSGSRQIPIETVNVQLVAHKVLAVNRPVSVKSLPKEREKDEDADSTYSDSYEGWVTKKPIQFER